MGHGAWSMEQLLGAGNSILSAEADKQSFNPSILQSFNPFRRSG
jgi:hypothetical protein